MKITALPPFFGAAFAAGLSLSPALGQHWDRRQDYACQITAGALSFGVIESSLLRPQEANGSLSVSCSCGTDSHGRERACPHISSNKSLYFCLSIDGLSNARGDRELFAVNNQRLPFRLRTAGAQDPGGFGNTLIGDGNAVPPLFFWAPNDYRGHSFPVRLAAAIYPGTYAPGAYSGQFNAILRYGIASIFSPGANCAPLNWPFRAETKLETSVAVKSSCNLKVTNDVAFGRLRDLSEAKPAYGKIEATCPPGAHYQIGIGAGLNPQSGGGRRAMKCAQSESCGGSFVEYDLFQGSACATKWDDKWNTDSILRGIGAGSPQAYDVCGKITPGQKTPPPGTYRDTVVLQLKLE